MSIMNDACINLGGKNTVQIHPGDRIVIKSPGGGGYGSNTSNISNISNTVDDGNTVPIPVPIPIKAPMVLNRTGGSVNQYTRDQEGV